MKRTLILLLILSFVINFSFAQKGEVRTFNSPVMTDSSSTLFFPIRYSEAVFSSHKIAFWGDYANVLIYDFAKDTYKSYLKMILISRDGLMKDGTITIGKEMINR